MIGWQRSNGNGILVFSSALLMSTACASTPVRPPVPSTAVSANLIGVTMAGHVAPGCDDRSSSLKEEQSESSPFFTRLQAKVRANWQPAAAYRQRDPKGQVFGTENRYTEVRVRLHKNGRLDGVSIERSSGLSWLDDLAVEAFQAAQPFERPPCQLLRPSDLVDFTYGFSIDVAALLAEIASAGNR